MSPSLQILLMWQRIAILIVVSCSIASVQALSAMNADMSFPSTNDNKNSVAAAAAPVPVATSQSLGGQVLRQAVLDAARHEDAQNQVDLHGIVWLEHVNLVVGSKLLAEMFYFTFLGMTRDPSASFHANLGQQQFHLAENGEPAQKVMGSIGLVVPSLQSIRERRVEAMEALKGTLFAVRDVVVADNEDDESSSSPPKRGMMIVTCPWGNTFHIYGILDDDSSRHDSTSTTKRSSSSQKMVKFHAEGGVYGAHRMAIRGNPGIRYVEMACPPGTVHAIARFYKEILHCTVSTAVAGRAVVCVGPGVHLVFVELVDDDDANALSNAGILAMKGVHICIYVSDFEGLYTRLAGKNLIWTNPRFTHLDSCDTWEEAVASRTLRFKDVIDLSTGETILELEHETRSLRHGQYLKVPKYEEQ